jgi:hypothetical protein
LTHRPRWVYSKKKRKKEKEISEKFEEVSARNTNRTCLFDSNYLNSNTEQRKKDRRLYKGRATETYRRLQKEARRLAKRVLDWHSHEGIDLATGDSD